jgi:hypothetical protein
VVCVAVIDALEAEALSVASSIIDAYSNSWGPTDNGYTLDAPGHVLSNAFEHAIATARYGLGAIYVWSAGNGALGMHCNTDHVVTWQLMVWMMMMMIWMMMMMIWMMMMMIWMIMMIRMTMAVRDTGRRIWIAPIGNDFVVPMHPWSASLFALVRWCTVPWIVEYMYIVCQCQCVSFCALSWLCLCLLLNTLCLCLLLLVVNHCLIVIVIVVVR